MFETIQFCYDAQTVNKIKENINKINAIKMYFFELKMRMQIKSQDTESDALIKRKKTVREFVTTFISSNKTCDLNCV